MATPGKSDTFVKEVLWTNKHRHLFRQVARETSGEVFDPPEGSRIFLAYLKSRDRTHNSDQKLIGVASYSPAKAKDLNPNDPFDSSFYHVITYLFVKPNFQGEGRGSYILYCMEKNIRSRAKRPIRLQSAAKAVGFFERHGYVRVGEPIDCVHGGSPLFSRLYNMQKDNTLSNN